MDEEITNTVYRATWIRISFGVAGIACMVQVFYKQGNRSWCFSQDHNLADFAPASNQALPLSYFEFGSKKCFIGFYQHSIEIYFRSPKKLRDECSLRLTPPKTKI